MTGIYRILNIITGQSYIGQSKDIMKRFEEHFYHRTAKNASYIDQDINKFGIMNFMFQILEICDFKDLDWKEEHWINYFGANLFGYNVVSGGQHNIGDSNANRKLKSYEVYEIREAYNRHEDPNRVYEQYKDRLSISYFFNLWEGKSWPNVHMDVYTPENKSYYKNIESDQKYKHYKFSDEDVLQYRQRYVNESAEQIYSSIATECRFNSFKSMLSGNTYKHVPIYSKKKKEWINS